MLSQDRDLQRPRLLGSLTPVLWVRAWPWRTVSCASPGGTPTPCFCCTLLVGHAACKHAQTEQGSHTLLQTCFMSFPSICAQRGAAVGAAGGGEAASAQAGDLHHDRRHARRCAAVHRPGDQAEGAAQGVDPMRNWLALTSDMVQRTTRAVSFVAGVTGSAARVIPAACGTLTARRCQPGACNTS